MSKLKGSNVNCPICGNDFYVMPCNLTKAKYCSRACQNKAKEKAVTKLCLTCNQPFTKAPSMNAQYCSRACFDASTKPDKICKVCAKPLRISVRTYCSKKCMLQDRTEGCFKPCKICGKDVWIVPSDGEQKQFCSRKCANEGHKVTGAGSSFVRADGYISVYYPTHEDASANGTVMQHRLVMEESIGRRLLKTEVVHHLNGIRHDNRLENLQLLATASEHSLITAVETKQKKLSQKAELAEYERRFGPLP